MAERRVKQKVSAEGVVLLIDKHDRSITMNQQGQNILHSRSATNRIFWNQKSRLPSSTVATSKTPLTTGVLRGRISQLAERQPQAYSVLSIFHLMMRQRIWQRVKLRRAQSDQQPRTRRLPSLNLRYLSRSLTRLTSWNDHPSRLLTPSTHLLAIAFLQ